QRSFVAARPAGIHWHFEDCRDRSARPAEAGSPQSRSPSNSAPVRLYQKSHPRRTMWPCLPVKSATLPGKHFSGSSLFLPAAPFNNLLDFVDCKPGEHLAFSGGPPYFDLIDLRRVAKTKVHAGTRLVGDTGAAD